MRISRRKFLQTSAAGGAALTVGAGASGCGNGVTAAPLASVVVDDNPLSATYGQIQVPVPVYPQLATVGGALTLKLQPLDPNDQNRAYALPPDEAILLVHYQSGSFAALQSSCPHAGCPLGYSAQDKLIECPCHSSRFRVVPDPANKTSCAGDVVHSPATAGLTAWAATLDGTGTFVTVDLKKPLPCNNTFPPVMSGTLTLPLADFPQLAMAGGAAGGLPTGAIDPIVVVRVDATRVVALDAKCTHRGCTVKYAPEHNDIECPCHGSTFGLDGSVTTGPATTALTAYSATLTANAIVVTLR
jgi:Rieske Fe-S protein